MTSHLLSAEELVELLTDAVAALDDGRSAREVVCLRLARLLDASAAAYVHLDLTRCTCTMLCWPSMITCVHLTLVTTELDVTTPGAARREHALDGAPSVLRAWQTSAAREMLSAYLGRPHLADVPLARTDAEQRLAVIARPTTFSGEERAMLRLLEHPLAALDTHLGVLERLRGAASVPAEAGPAAVPAGGTAPLGLTRRELEVLTMLAEGLLAETIAARLSVSPRTVHKHLGSVYRKLDCHDRLLAVRRALGLGLLPSIPAPSLVGDRAGP